MIPRADAATGSRPGPAAALSNPDRVATGKENLVLRQDRLHPDTSRITVVSPAARLGMKHGRTDVERMTVGFTYESWRERFGPVSGQPESGFNPPRPVRLIQPHPYYNLYPFTLDSVQINVRAKINTLGVVTSAETLSWGNALLDHLSSIAIRAARESTFVPARTEGINVPSTAVLSYRFLRRK